jgi:hypothetical protein
MGLYKLLDGCALIERASGHAVHILGARIYTRREEIHSGSVLFWKWEEEKMPRERSQSRLKVLAAGSSLNQTPDTDLKKIRNLPCLAHLNKPARKRQLRRAR